MNVSNSTEYVLTFLSCDEKIYNFNGTLNVFLSSSHIKHIVRQLYILGYYIQKLAGRKK